MAVIDVRTEPTGRTRMMFDFRAAAPGCDDVARIEYVIMRSRDGMSCTIADAPVPRAQRQAASDSSTSRSATLASRRRISAS
jgi:hypothetical protein